MSANNNSIIELYNPKYVPIIKDSEISYGGSQMWFANDNKLSKDYVICNYGCGTIAAADLFLYLALQDEALRSPETGIAIQNNNLIQYENYISYVRSINDNYINTHRIIAVLGPKLAIAISEYAKTNNFDYQASWKHKLNYYDMYQMMEEMLSEDIPVILSIGPNTPKIWGKEGISFYDKIENPKVDGIDNSTDNVKPYSYKSVSQGINSHYVMVTALIKDDITNTIMLRISSWGTQYYINYEEYRNYIETTGDTITSSIVYVNKILW